MKFKIVSKAFTDKSLENTIIKTMEYFASINKEKSDKIVNKQNNQINKEAAYSLLQELVDYVEVGLKKLYSMNFNVLVTETPNYALKFEKGCFLSLNYLDFVILVYKTPFICVPGKFMRATLDSVKEKEVSTTKNLLIKTLLNETNYLMLNFSKVENNKAFIKLTQDDITNMIFDNIAYCCVMHEEDKDFLGILAQSIQSDMSFKHSDFSFGVVIGKKHLFSPSFLATSSFVYRSKIINNSGFTMVDNGNNTDNNTEINSLNQKSQRVKAPKLKDTEILIYHKKAKFESVLGSIMTGKFRNVEFKHIFILLSVIIFFVLIGGCKLNIEELNAKENLTWFEDNVCKNKGQLLSTIGVMFIMIIVMGVIKKKVDNKKQRKPNLIKDKSN